MGLVSGIRPSRIVTVSGLQPASVVTVPATGPSTRRITLHGVASAEAFGSLIVNLVHQYVSPTGLASAAAYGAPQLNLKITANGLAAADDYGSPQINLSLQANGIATAEDFGSPTLSSGLDIATWIYLSDGGQSNMAGSTSTPILSSLQPFSNTRWNRGAGTFDALIETSLETPDCGLANWLTEQEQTPSPGRVSVTDNWAIGGTAYSAMAKGTGPYTNMAAAMAAAAAAAPGGTTWRAAQVWVHGETDDGNGVSAATYQGYMEALQSDFETDAQAALGFAGTVPLVYSQVASWPQYSPILVRSTVALGQLQAALDNPTKIFCAGPNYHLPVQSSGANLHYTNVGMRRLGEYLAKSLYYALVRQQPRLPLYVSGATAAGNIVTLTVGGGDGSDLAIDTTTVRERSDRGIEYTDGSASPAAITDVSVSGRTITVTLNKDAAALANSPLVRVALTAPNDAPVGPTGNGPGSNIRDQDPAASRQGGEDPLRNWLSTQEIALTSSTPTGVTAPSWANAHSMRFASSSQYARNAEWDAVDGLGSWTIAFWIKRDSAPGSTVAAFARNITNRRQLDFRFTATGAIQAFLATNLTTVVNASTAAGAVAYGASTWNHVAFVFDGSLSATARLAAYVGAVAKAFSSPPSWPATMTSPAYTELAIGSGSNGTPALALGNMRDVAVWAGHAASAAEVSEIYNGGTVRDPALASFGVPGNLWRGETDWADYGSGVPRHLTAFSGATIQAAHP